MHTRNTKETKLVEFIKLSIMLHIGNNNKEKEVVNLRGSKAEYIWREETEAGRCCNCILFFLKKERPGRRVRG